MNSPKTIVKETAAPTPISKDTQRRTPPDAASPTLVHKVSEGVHIEITPERIRIRAYEIYLAHNGAPEDPISDWCQAERELNGQSSSQCAGGETACDQATLEIKTRTQSPCSAEAGAGIRGGL
ncbi:hypothetical protein PHYC_00534 [Phycisphaerales bacterium]|nr:hypothetical protein PHYC_00534 [Phycisphaerales bacterium]